MRVHHFNCATLSPVGAAIAGIRSRSRGIRLVCHCLLVECDGGLLLIDSGLGLRDIGSPRSRLGFDFLHVARPRLDPEETAARRVERLGFSRDDVRHIVLTHLDLDHAGGISDFPRARVHVSEREHEAAMSRRTLRGRFRYKPVHWEHGPDWVLHRGGGAPWFGLETAGRVEGFPAEVVLLPLPGHSPGHCGVAVRAPDRWILHAGDAYFHHREIDLDRPRCPWGLALFQRLVQSDGAARAGSRERLRSLQRSHPGELTILCSHDPHDLPA